MQTATLICRCRPPYRSADGQRQTSLRMETA